MGSHRRTTAIRLPNWIGDAVMAVPTLREVRRLYPQDRLVLIGSSWVTDLFRHQRLADEIRLLPSAGSALTRLRGAATLFNGCDRALLLPNSWASALPPFLARVRVRAGYHREGRRLVLTEAATPRARLQNRHQIYHYLDLLFQTGFSTTDYLGTPEFEPSISLEAGAKALESAAELLPDPPGASPLIGINPGAAYGSAKRWPLQRYAALADRFASKLGATVVLVGSTAERELAERVSSEMNQPATILTGRTNLSQLMGVLARLDLFVSNDSGPMHVAAALSVPQVALFGSTDEIATGPWNKQTAVIHKPVECSPCLLRECPIDLRCFRQISVAEVFDRSRRLLDFG